MAHLGLFIQLLGARVACEHAFHSLAICRNLLLEFVLLLEDLPVLTNISMSIPSRPMATSWAVNKFASLFLVDWTMP